MKNVIVKNSMNKTYATNLISELPETGEYEIIIKKVGLDSTSRQRRLQWMWYTEVSRSGLGRNDDKRGVHLDAKWQFARPILLRDDDVFVDIYNGFMEIIDRYDPEIKKECIRAFCEDYISTEKMTKEQRAEYLTEFQLRS